MTDLTYYILSGLLTLAILAGLVMMAKVKTAKAGNLLSAIAIALAILITLYKYKIFSDLFILFFILLGLVIGLIIARLVKMISMPQLVALLNGLGGAASALVGFMAIGSSSDIFGKLTALLALAIGGLTLSGSLVAGGKLQGILSQKPLFLKNHSLLTYLTLVLTILSGGLSIFINSLQTLLPLLTLVFSLLFGLVFSIRVGGADMPITISLLNSLSGLAGALAGMAISDPLLVVVGGLVGSSGLLLTQIMCKAMNRPLKDILLGKTSTRKEKANEVEINKEKESVQTNTVEEDVILSEVKESKEEVDIKSLIDQANTVIIIPGYGMALAQAQSLVKELEDKLESKNKEVQYGIHPVAGRMPGHMNVLLAEVDVDYDKLLEMDDVNPLFKETDIAIVVGANDVINPAANTAQGTPIYGMPILHVEEAKHIIICNFDLKPGYAGVENPIYENPKTTLLLGDAKDSLLKLLEMV